MKRFLIVVFIVVMLLSLPACGAGEASPAAGSTAAPGQSSAAPSAVSYKQKDIVALLTETPLWSKQGDLRMKYLFRADGTGMYGNDIPISGDEFTWVYDAKYKELTISDLYYDAPCYDLELGDGYVSLSYSYYAPLVLLPARAPVTELPAGGSCPEEFVGTLLAPYSGYLDEHNWHWDLNSDGSGLEYIIIAGEKMMTCPLVWTVAGDGNFYIRKDYKSGGESFLCFSYIADGGGWRFTNLWDEYEFPVTKEGAPADTAPQEDMAARLAALSPDMTGTRITAEDPDAHLKREGLKRCYVEYYFEDNRCTGANMCEVFTDEPNAKYIYDQYIGRGVLAVISGCEVASVVQDKDNPIFGNSYYEGVVNLTIMEYQLILE